MNPLNVVFSYLLIYGMKIGNEHFLLRIPGLGIQGDAFGIAIARTIGAVLVSYALFNGSNLIKIEVERNFKFNFELLRSIYGIGLSASVESLLFSGGKLITQTFIVAMGTASIAANYVTISIAGLICIPADALCIAATILVGQYMGRRDSSGAKEILMYLVKVASLCLLGLGAITFPFAGILASAFTDSKDVVVITSVLIRVYILIIPLLYVVSFILQAGLKGTGDVKFTMTVSMLGMWAFRIILGYIVGVTFKVGVLGVWIGMYVDWIVRGALFYIRLQRGKWKENVVVRNVGEAV